MEQKNALFEQMPVRKAFFKLALPVVLSMVVSLVYNMVDTYFIAKTGNAHLVAGVALGSPVFTLMIAVGDIFGLGGSSFISRLFGQKRDQDGKRLSVFCFYGALFTGVGITALLLLLRTPLLTVLGAQADTVQYARDYYTWIAVGAPFIILSFTPCNQLRTEGFANASMIGSILGAVVNIVLDPVLIFGCKLGAAGAAIATVIGYVFTDLYYVVSAAAQPSFVCGYSAAAGELAGGGPGVCHRYSGFHYQYCPELLCADHQPVFGALRYG